MAEAVYGYQGLPHFHPERDYVWQKWRYGLEMLIPELQLDLHVIYETLSGNSSVVVSHFDTHPLGSRPILIDDNAKPHRARQVQDSLHQDDMHCCLGQQSHRL